MTSASPNPLEQLEQQVTDLRSQGVPSTQLIDALNALAQALSWVDLQQALANAKEARLLSRQLQYRIGTATSLARLSWLHLEGGEFDAAVLEAREAQFLAEQMQDHLLSINATFVIACAQQLAGKYAQAESSWRQMLRLVRNQGDRAREADYLNALGLLHLEQTAYEDALENFAEAHSIFVDLADANAVAAKNNLALALTKLGRHAQAVTWVEQALAECDPEWQIWRAIFLHTLGVAHMNLRHYEQARTCFTESLGMSEMPAGRKQTAIEVLLDFSKLDLLGNNIPAAYDSLERALAVADAIKSVSLQADAHHALSRLYSLAHDSAHADEHYEHYLERRSHIERQRMEKQMNLIRVEAEAESRHALWLQEG